MSNRALLRVIAALAVLCCIGLFAIVGLLGYRFLAAAPNPNPRDADREFVFAAEACAFTVAHWGQVSGELADNPAGACGSWQERATRAAEAMGNCWKAMPAPTDTNLLEVRRQVAIASERYEVAMRIVSDYCRGKARLDGALDNVLKGNMAMQRANEAMDAYRK